LYHFREEFVFSNDLSSVRINEIHVANIDQFIDNSFNYGGWIELYNTSSALHALDKARIRHTDADGIVEEQVLDMGHGLLKSNGFTCLWFDHNSADGNFGGKSHQQIPFKMDPDGGTLELIDAGGTTVDQINYPPSIARCSYARTTDGGDTWGWTGTASPNASNNQSVFATDRLEAPVIDKESTLFTNNISFNVRIPAGTKLRYTTDGSTPTATHGITSTNGSFTTYSTKIFRFVLIADDKLPSQVITRTFIKDENGLQLPVLSISTHPDNLYDDVIGVYTKGTNGISGNGQDSPCNWNMDWDRPVNVEYLIKEENGYRPVLNQEAEFKIAGGWSRAYGGGNGWPMKSSFRLKSGKVYEGKNSFDYPIFAGKKDYNKYKTLQVRNGGNDTYARFLDQALHEIFRSSGFYLDCQASQPCHVFFNGEYLGLLNIRENNNKHYGDSGYGIDTDEIDQFELNGVVGYEQKAGDREAFWQWLTLSKQIAANPNNKEIWAQICELVDIDEYCNYMAAECYIGSTDWLTNCNNIKGFRSRKDNGKFHMMMFDTDAAFNNNNMIASIYDMLQNNDGRFSDNNGKNYLTEIFFNMMKYEPFKQQFIHAFSIVDGSVMEPERCRKIIDEMSAYTKQALALEGNDPSSSASWLYNRIANEGERGIRRSNLKAFFNLKKEYKVRLESNIPEARLLLDGQEIPTRKFDGIIFRRANITAKAPASYVFKGWNLISSSAEQNTLIPFRSTWQYYDKGSLDGTSWKAQGFTASNWKNGKAPFGYGTVGTTANAADYYTTIDYGGDPNKKRPTYYFRKTFTLTEEPSYEDRFYIHYYLDDGALFYINGTEVGGYHCNSGVSYDDFSTTHEGNTAAYGTIEIPATALQKGNNVITVEVHNTSFTSSDIFFDAKVEKAKFKTTFLGKQETITLNDEVDNSIYHLTAVYEEIKDPLKRMEAG
ncbi:MAG: CotH kinase family protein, partial [Bacteroidaceae bacterium]|nr:CotH kinase family protein [Bacteroidaceae bacterium]